MANVPDASKERITYAEYSDVRDDLVQIAKDLGNEEGREVSETEIIRRLTLKLVNERRKAMGRPLLTLDPTTKPGGNPMTRRSKAA